MSDKKQEREDVSKTNRFEPLLRHWKWLFMLVPAIALIFMSNFANKASSDSVEMQESIDVLTEELDGLKARKDELEGSFDEIEYEEVVVEGKTSAEKIAKEVIAVQDRLASFYKNPEPLPVGNGKKVQAKRDKILKKVKEDDKLNNELTGAKEGDVNLIWKLNPEWDLKLESTVIYGDVKRFPVIFSMHTKKGEPAGIVQAEYHVDAHKLTDVVRHYTNEGLRDEADVGGR